MFDLSLKKILLAIFLAPSLSAPSLAEDAANTANKLPIDIFAKLPTMSHFRLSPDGTQFAYITSSKGRKNIIIQVLDGSKAVSLPPIGDGEFFKFWWATNKRLLIGIQTYSKQRDVTITTSETRLLAVDATLKNSNWIVKASEKDDQFSRVNKSKYPLPQIQTQIVDLLPNDPDHILLTVDGDMDARDEVRRINIHTGKFKELRTGTRGIQYWYTDQKGQLSFGTGYDDHSAKWVATLRMPDGTWADMDRLKAFDKYDFKGFTADNNIVFVSGSSQFGTKGLYKMNLTSGEIVETVFEHEKVDIDGILSHPRTGNAVGVAYTVDIQEYHYFDPEFDQIQRIAQKALKNNNVQVIEKVQGKAQYVLFARDQKEPGVYYWYDHDAKALSFISPVRPNVDPALMAETKAVSIPMRDGSQIPGYLTLPVGMEAKDLPTIIYPHGGPQARSSAHWNYTAQFLANRGYAVLQPNFRGSDGYGYEFRSKGKKQWGGLMQEDVTDATKWVVDQGMADSDNICIMGASYGGYSALMGVIQEPGLYKCAISVNGVTNIKSMKINDKRFIGGVSWVDNMGRKGSNDNDVSPYQQAKKVSAPVLIMSSKDDTRIDYDWSEDFHKKLKKLKKDSTYVLIEDGGHSMDTENSRLTKLTNLEKFLAKHIGD